MVSTNAEGTGLLEKGTEERESPTLLWAVG